MKNVIFSEMLLLLSLFLFFSCNDDNVVPQLVPPELSFFPKEESFEGKVSESISFTIVITKIQSAQSDIEKLKVVKFVNGTKVLEKNLHDNLPWINIPDNSVKEYTYIYEKEDIGKIVGLEFQYQFKRSTPSGGTSFTGGTRKVSITTTE